MSDLPATLFGFPVVEVDDLPEPETLVLGRYCRVCGGAGLVTWVRGSDRINVDCVACKGTGVVEAV